MRNYYLKNKLGSQPFKFNGLKVLIFHLLVLLLFILVVGCGPTPQSQAPAQPVTLRMLTHQSFAVSDDVVAKFEDETGVKLEIIDKGDSGEILKYVIEQGDSLEADVLYGVDNTFISLALESGVFERYTSPVLSKIDQSLAMDPEYHLSPVDYGDVCLNYDKSWFETNKLAPPQSLEDLIDPAYANLTVVENPALSSPGHAFLLTTVAHFGLDNYLDFWQALVANGVLVVDGWSEAYFENFTAASDGDRPIVVSYASSPPATIVFSEEPLDEAPIAAVVEDETCFRQIEFAGILKASKHQNEAKKLIDFLLDVPFQEDVPLSMFVYPVNTEAALPDVFVKHSRSPAITADIAPSTIADNREAWIAAWSEVVLK